MPAPARPRDLSIVPVALSLLVCFGLGAFAVLWSAWQSDCYDDSDPFSYLGAIVLVLAVPGIAMGLVVATLRVFVHGRNDTWAAVSWAIVWLYLTLAVLVALGVWFGWDGRVYCGGNPYGD